MTDHMTADLLLQEGSKIGNSMWVEKSTDPKDFMFIAIAAHDEDPSKDGECILLTKDQAIRLKNWIEALLQEESR